MADAAPGALTPAPGRPLSLLGETPGLAGRHSGPVPSRRNDRRPSSGDLPEFRATAVGAWVAATAPERARQTEARAAASLAEAARRNAGKFTPTQPGSRNAPPATNPVAAPRRGNAGKHQPTAPPQPASNPSARPSSASNPPVRPSSDSNPPVPPTSNPPVLPTSEPSNPPTSESPVPPTSPNPTAPTATNPASPHRPASGSATPNRPASAPDSPGETARAAAVEETRGDAGTSRIVGTSAEAATSSADVEITRSAAIENSEGDSAAPLREPEVQGESPTGTVPATPDVRKTAKASTVQAVAVQAVVKQPRNAEPPAARLVLSTGPAATDWTATATTRIGLPRAPQESETSPSVALTPPPVWPPIGERAADPVPAAALPGERVPERRPIVPFPAEPVPPAPERSGGRSGTTGDSRRTDPSDAGRTSIHAVETAIPVLDQKTANRTAQPEPTEPRPEPTEPRSAPEESARTSMHLVETDGPAALGKGSAPVPTQGSVPRSTDGNPLSGKAAPPVAMPSGTGAPAAGAPDSHHAETAAEIRAEAGSGQRPAAAVPRRAGTAGERSSDAAETKTPRKTGRSATDGGTGTVEEKHAGEKRTETAGEKRTGARDAPRQGSGGQVRKQPAVKGDAAPLGGPAEPKGVPGRPAPGARRAPAAWIKAAESVAARAKAPSDDDGSGRARGYREEAAELLARGNDRRRRRTVSGQARSEPGNVPSTDAGQPEAPAGPKQAARQKRQSADEPKKQD